MAAQNRSYKDRLVHLEKLNRNQFREIERLRAEAEQNKKTAFEKVTKLEKALDTLLARKLWHRIVNKKTISW